MPDFFHIYRDMSQFEQQQVMLIRQFVRDDVLVGDGGTGKKTGGGDGGGRVEDVTIWRENTRARLRLYGHVRRKDDMYIGRRMPRMELPGKRKREGQKGRLWMR